MKEVYNFISWANKIDPSQSVYTRLKMKNGPYIILQTLNIYSSLSPVLIASSYPNSQKSMSF